MILRACDILQQLLLLMIMFNAICGVSRSEFSFSFISILHIIKATLYIVFILTLFDIFSPSDDLVGFQYLTNIKKCHCLYNGDLPYPLPTYVPAPDRTFKPRGDTGTGPISTSDPIGYSSAQCYSYLGYVSRTSHCLHTISSFYVYLIFSLKLFSYFLFFV